MLIVEGGTMRMKRIGAVVAGAALLGATLAGAATAQQLDVPDRDFFVDAATGLNNCLLIVGAEAAAADVVSASYIAAQIGTMAYTEEIVENWIRPGVVYETNATDEFEGLVDNYLSGEDFDENFDDFRDAINYAPPLYDSTGPESWAVLPYVCEVVGENPITDAVTYKNSMFDMFEPWGYVELDMVSFPPNPYNATAPDMVPLEPWWDYDVYVDARTAMSPDLGFTEATAAGGNFLVDTGCSFEAITVDFSIRDIECSAEFCTACLAACDQDGLFSSLAQLPIGFEIPDLYECQTYPNVYQRHYWGTPEGYADAQDEYTDPTDPYLNYCDPTGGVEYRAIVDGIGYQYNGETWEYDSMVDFINWCAIVVPSDPCDMTDPGAEPGYDTCPPSEAYLVCNEHAPMCVTLYCDPCDVFFLGENYDALRFGTDVQGYDFMLYGTPKWYVEEKLAVGETKEYNGWGISIIDLGIYENKAYVKITDPCGEVYDYMVVIDQYTSQSPSNGDGDSPQCNQGNSLIFETQQNGLPCTCGDTAGANEENDTIAFVQRVFDAYDLCGDNAYGIIDYGWGSEYNSCGASYTSYPHGEVVFAVKFIKTMIGAAGTYIVEYHAYNLADYGVLKEQIYAGPCETPTDPAISVNGLDWYFDVIPGNGILVDGTSGEILDLDNDPDLYAEGNPNFDVADMLTIYNSMVPAPVSPTASQVDYLRNYFHAYKDCNEWMLYSRMGASEGDYLVPKCSPMLELWLATPVELAGLCDDELIVELADCLGNNYFTLVATDETHNDYEIDTSISVYRTELDSTDVVRTYVDLDTTMLVKLDQEIDLTLKESYNLILVGGPVANGIVAELVDLGETTMELWETSDGDVVLLEDVYSVGKDVLIVAGADRDRTAAAAILLINAL